MQHASCRPDDLEDCLTGEPLDPDTTYWCQHCHRTFPGRAAREDFFGGRQGCASPDCGACGLGIDIFRADDPYVTGEYGDGYDDHEDADDLAYRDDLLHLGPIPSVPGIGHFEGLELGNLAKVLELRVADPDGRHHRAPSTLECVTFLCRWPEVQLHGHVARTARHDGGTLHIEGLSCDLRWVDDARREALRQAFLAFAATADLLEDEPTDLYACWD
jgi:hypothetical protein